MKAKVKDNRPYCRECNSILCGAIVDVTSVLVDGQAGYSLVSRYCGDDRCHCLNKYLLSISIESETRLEIDDYFNLSKILE